MASDITDAIARAQDALRIQAEGDPGCAKEYDNKPPGYRGGCPGCRWIEADATVSNAGGPLSVALAAAFEALLDSWDLCDCEAKKRAASLTPVGSVKHWWACLRESPAVQETRQALQDWADAQQGGAGGA